MNKELLREILILKWLFWNNRFNTSFNFDFYNTDSSTLIFYNNQKDREKIQQLKNLNKEDKRTLAYINSMTFLKLNNEYFCELQTSENDEKSNQIIIQSLKLIFNNKKFIKLKELLLNLFSYSEWYMNNFQDISYIYQNLIRKVWYKDWYLSFLKFEKEFKSKIEKIQKDFENEWFKYLTLLFYLYFQKSLINTISRNYLFVWKIWILEDVSNSNDKFKDFNEENYQFKDEKLKKLYFFLEFIIKLKEYLNKIWKEIEDHDLYEQLYYNLKKYDYLN